MFIIWDEFSMNLYLRCKTGIGLPEIPNQFLNPGVVIGAIKCRNPCLNKRRHIFDRLIWVNLSVTSSEMPPPFDQTRD